MNPHKKIQNSLNCLMHKFQASQELQPILLSLQHQQIDHCVLLQRTFGRNRQLKKLLKRLSKTNFQQNCLIRQKRNHFRQTFRQQHSTKHNFVKKNKQQLLVFSQTDIGKTPKNDARIQMMYRKNNGIKGQIIRRTINPKHKNLSFSQQRCSEKKRSCVTEQDKQQNFLISSLKLSKQANLRPYSFENQNFVCKKRRIKNYCQDPRQMLKLQLRDSCLQRSYIASNQNKLVLSVNSKNYQKLNYRQAKQHFRTLSPWNTRGDIYN